MKRANAFVVGLVAVLLALAVPPAAAQRTRKPAVAARPVAAARVPAPVKKRGLPATVATVSAPTVKILTSLVPWPQGVRLPEEKGGVWRTTNHTEDLYSKPVVDAASEKAHDRALDEILDARRGDRSVLLIGGINLGGAPKHNPAHGSSSNFDKSKRVRGQLNLAVANEQLELRLVGGVPLEPGADVAELMKRLGQAPDSVAPRVKRKDLELPKGVRGLVLLDYYELTDDARVNGLLAKAKAQPHKVFDLLVDPVDVAAEAPRLQRIQRLLDARLPNLRLFTTRLAKAQQLQHRKIYN